MEQSEIKFYEEWDKHINPSINAIDKEKPTNDQISSYVSLMGMKKRADESFRQYALRWMEEVAQIRPLLIEKEMIGRFIGILQAPYYEKVVKSFPKSFTDVAVLCRMINEVMKNELGRKITAKTKGKKIKANQ